MPERVLALTYAFPPIAVPESFLSVKRLANLPCEVEVISIPAFKPWMGDDNSLDPYIENHIARVQRVQPPPVRKQLPLGRLGPLTRIPDQFRLFNSLLYKVAKARLTEFDHLLTWSQWHSVHLVGARLASTSEAPPWTAHMSDPWSNNPYVEQGNLLRAINSRLEKGILERADLLSFPAEETADRVLSVHPEAVERTVILPHSFEPLFYEQSAHVASSPIVVRYIGHFYGPRSPRPLFFALRELNRRSASGDCGVRLEIVGNVPRKMMEEATILPPGQVLVRPPVGYLQSLKLMSASDILLVIDAPAEKSPFLPSKLIDYLGARRPIVTVSPSGPAARLTHEYGGWVAEPHDVTGIACALEAAVRWVGSADSQAIFGREKIRRRYEAKRVSGEMAVAMQNLTHTNV